MNTKVIYKYGIHDGVNHLPAGEILDYECQSGAFYVWILQWLGEDKKREYKIDILGTGWEFDEDKSFKMGWHAKTIHSNGFVWHVFCKDCGWVE